MLGGRRSYQETAGKVLNYLHGLMIVVREVIFRDVGQQSIRDRDTVFEGAGARGMLDKSTDRGVIRRQMSQLVAHMTRARNSVGFSDSVARTGHQFEQRQFIRHRGEAMESNEVQADQS